METPQSHPALVYSALVLIQVLFGVNYVITKVVVDHFPPLVWASFRIIVSALLMLSVCLLFRRERRPRDGARFFVPMIGFSLLGAIINQGSFLVGLHYTSATNSAVLNTLIPVFTLLIVTLRGQEPLSAGRFFGFVLAFSGVLAIRKVEELSFSNQTMIGDLLTVLNCLSYGFFLSYGKKFFERYDRVWSTTWLFMYGSVGLTALAAPGWRTFDWPPMDGLLLGCMAFAILGGTLLTYFLNIWTLAQVRSSSVAIFIYLQPIIATLLAWAWMGQVPTARTVFSSFLIFCGLVLTLYSRAPMPAKLDRRS